MPSSTFEDDHRPDYLAGAVLQSLSRAMGPRWYWGAVKTMLVAALSLGLMPVLIWQRRFRDFVVGEQQQIWHLAEWLRLRSGNPQAVALRDQVDRVRFRVALQYLTWFILAAVTAAIASHLWTTGGDFDDLLDLTYRFPQLLSRSPQQANVHLLWMAGLSAAYALHWIQVQLHAADMRRLVQTFNRLAATEGIAPLAGLPNIGIGLRPIWMLGAALLLGLGVFWGVPMMMAGALHKRYVLLVSTDLRSELAFRVRALLLVQRPLMRVPRPPRLRMNCPSDLCRNAVPEIANFCPRCGTPVKPVLNAVA